jgi:hypothetical protein
VAIQRIAVDEHHRLAAAVILVVNLDIGIILGPNGDKWHDCSFLA